MLEPGVWVSHKVHSTRIGRSSGPSAPGLQGLYYENFSVDILCASPDGSLPVRSDFHRFNKMIRKAVSQTSLKNAFNLIFTGTDAQERLLPVSDHYLTSIRGDTNPDHSTFPRFFTRANSFDDLFP